VVIRISIWIQDKTKGMDSLPLPDEAEILLVPPGEQNGKNVVLSFFWIRQMAAAFLVEGF